MSNRFQLVQEMFYLKKRAARFNGLRNFLSLSALVSYPLLVMSSGVGWLSLPLLSSAALLLTVLWHPEFVFRNLDSLAVHCSARFRNAPLHGREAAPASSEDVLRLAAWLVLANGLVATTSAGWTPLLAFGVLYLAVLPRARSFVPEHVSGR